MEQTSDGRARGRGLKRTATVRFVGYVVLAVGGLVAGMLLVSLGVVDKVDGIPGTQQEPIVALPTYLGFVSTMMTAVTAVLAAVAIFIGIVAAYTFRELSDRAEKAVAARVEEKLRDIDAIIIDRVDEIAFRTRRDRPLEELRADFDPSDAGER